MSGKKARRQRRGHPSHLGSGRTPGAVGGVPETGWGSSSGGELSNAEMVSKLFEGVDRAEGWTIEGMLAVSMQFMDAMTAGHGLMIVAQSSADTDPRQICAGDLGTVVAELGVAHNGGPVDEDFPAKLAAAMISRGVRAGVAIIPAWRPKTNGAGRIHLLVVDGVAQAMKIDSEGCSWLAGLGAEGDAPEMLTRAMAETVGLSRAEFGQLARSLYGAPARGQVGGGGATMAPRPLKLADFVVLLGAYADRALALDPARDPVAFVGELAGLKITLTNGLDQVGRAVVEPRRDPVYAACAERWQELVCDEGVLWGVARDLLAEFVRNIDVAVGQGDAPATADGLLQVWCWAEMAQDVSKVSVLEFAAACRRCEATNPMAKWSAWLERGAEEYEVLRSDLRAASKTVKWPPAGVDGNPLLLSISLVQRALEAGSVDAVMEAVTWGAVLAASQLKWMGLLDLWPRGQSERAKSLDMWKTSLLQGSVGTLDVVDALEAAVVHLEGSIAERDLVNAYDAEGRLFAILGALTEVYDPDGAYDYRLEEVRNTLNGLISAPDA